MTAIIIIVIIMIIIIILSYAIKYMLKAKRKNNNLFFPKSVQEKHRRTKLVQEKTPTQYTRIATQVSTLVGDWNQNNRERASLPVPVTLVSVSAGP